MSLGFQAVPRDLSNSETTAVRLYVTGLHCAGCVGRTEKALNAVEGVQAASINLATGRADVRFSEPATLDQIRIATKDAGYGVETETLILDVQGATCASCVARIENALTSVPGVINASMNLVNGRATVEVVSGAVQNADLIAATGRAGYVSELSDSDGHATKPATADRSLLQKLIIAAILTLPVFTMEMGGHLYPPLHHWVQQTIGLQTSYLLQFVLTSSVLFLPGLVFFTSGIPALVRRAPDMNSLVALGAGAAWLYSSCVTFWPEIFPAGARFVYFESAAVIVTLILFGRWLEARAKGRAGDAISKLVELAPATATLIRDGAQVAVEVADIVVGDVLMLRPGERVAVDGKVVTGTSFLDESMVTGEPVPVVKSADGRLTAGTLNGNGVLTYRATAVGQDTVLARIIRMVEDAQGGKLPVQALVDKITAWFVPAVLLIALLTVAVWVAVGPDPVVSNALVAGVAVLIIACPCAMGLATPMSILVGTGRAAQLGVLFRSGDALQALDNTRVIALDKTGTVTKGQPEMTDLDIAPGHDRDAVLALVGATEAMSEHPIALAVAGAARAEIGDLPLASEFTALTGLGVQAQVGETDVKIGNRRLMVDSGVDIAGLETVFAQRTAQAKTAFFVALDGRLAAVIAVSDPEKPSSAAAVSRMKQLGLTVAMITGDNAQTADAIAANVGIDIVRAEVLPDQKVAAVRDLRDRLGDVAFVGDGINDAPALAEANVGIAVGTGTDIAIEAADVVLMQGDLNATVDAIGISKATMRNIRQNLFWAFGYNVILIPVAAGALYPTFGLTLSPALAAGAMALSSVFVVTNALRLRGFAKNGGQT